MALEQTVRNLQVQDAQFKEMFLNLSKGQEELKALLTESMTKKNPEDNKDDQLEQLQAEMAMMRIQMMGQMALIQNLARGQEELRILISKLYQDRCDRMGQTAKIWGLINDQPLLEDRELGDMFMRGHVENKLKSGEIQGDCIFKYSN